MLDPEFLATIGQMALVVILTVPVTSVATGFVLALTGVSMLFFFGIFQGLLGAMMGGVQEDEE